MNPFKSLRVHRASWLYPLLIVTAFFSVSSALHAQSLGWEGESGIFVTPTAYTIATPKRSFAIPTASYHFLHGGDVIGQFSQLSVTSGYRNRVEFGYTRDFHDAGDTPALSPLWK